MNIPKPKKEVPLEALKARIARLERRLTALKAQSEQATFLDGLPRHSRPAVSPHLNNRAPSSNTLPCGDLSLSSKPVRDYFVDEAFVAGLVGRFHWDFSRGVAHWTPELANLYGIENASSEIDIEVWKTWVVPEDLPGLLSAINVALTTGAFELEWRVIRQNDHSVRWLTGRAKILYDAAGTPVRMVGINLDVTDRKRAETALREAEDRLRAAARAAQFGYYDADFLSGYHYWSPEMRDLLGYPAEAPAPSFGKTPNFVHPDDSEAVTETMKRALSGLFSPDLFNEHRVFRPDGSMRWVQMRGVARFQGEGEQRRAAGYSGLILDITDSKLSEQALRDAQARLQTALQSMTDAVFISDASGAPVQFNDAFITFHRFATREECIAGIAACQRTLEIYSLPDERLLSPTEYAVARALRGETASNAEVRLRRTDTGESWMASLSFAPIRDKDGAITGAVLAARDITERKQDEEALRLLTLRFETALKNSSVVVFTQDLDLRYTWIYNPALGYSPSEVIGRRDTDVFERTEDGRATEALKVEVIRTGHSRRKEFPVYWQGVERFYDLQVDPLRNPAGYIVGVVCAAIDVTDRRKAEQALLRSEKLSSVGRYAATVAHEINNPLEAVTNLLYLMRLQIDDRPSVERLLGMAEDELRRVANVTRQALGFYREMSLPQRTTLAPIVESALEILRAKISTRRASVRSNIQADLCLEVVPGEIRQVVVNLLSNCIDAVPTGGTISLVARVVKPCPDRPPTIRILMADNGHGIDVKHLAHIFEPLYSTKGGTGAGLGLWVARQIVEKHGGSIRVRSRTSGRYCGTTFLIDLPVIGARPKIQETSSVEELR